MHAGNNIQHSDTKECSLCYTHLTFVLQRLIQILYWDILVSWVHSSTVSWGNTLQAGRSWVPFPMGSVDFLLSESFQPYYGPGVDSAGAKGWQPYHFHVPSVLKSGGLNLLEALEPVQATTGIALLSCLYISNNCKYSAKLDKIFKQQK
jgi:hypothetical protein